MSASSIHLTPFEEKVLQVCAQWIQQHGASRKYRFYSINIASEGRHLYNHDWAGKRVSPARGYSHYPTINAAFGRLAKKGLLLRQEDGMFDDLHSSAGFWCFTDQAYELLGIPSPETGDLSW